MAITVFTWGAIRVSKSDADEGRSPPPAAGSRLPPAGGVATKGYFLEGKLDYSGKIGLNCSYGHLPVISGYFYGIIHSINGVISTYN